MIELRYLSPLLSSVDILIVIFRFLEIKAKEARTMAGSTGTNLQRKEKKIPGSTGTNGLKEKKRKERTTPVAQAPTLK
jgi:hypothetical protein